MDYIEILNEDELLQLTDKAQVRENMWIALENDVSPSYWRGIFRGSKKQSMHAEIAADLSSKFGDLSIEFLDCNTELLRDLFERYSISEYNDEDIQLFLDNETQEGISNVESEKILREYKHKFEYSKLLAQGLGKTEKVKEMIETKGYEKYTNTRIVWSFLIENFAK